MKSIQGKWRKSVLLIIILTLCVLLLAGCAGKTELPSDYDQAKIEEAGIKVINLVNAHDYQAIRDMSIEEVKEILTDETMQKVHARVKELGEFKKLKNVDIFGYKNEQGQEYAAFVAKAIYEKKSVVYSFTFSKDAELSGFYAKNIR